MRRRLKVGWNINGRSRLILSLALLAAAPVEPCTFPRLDETLRCLEIEVFENRATRTGRTLKLRVAILPARDSSPAPAEPIFVLVGGPGIPATYNVEFFASIFSAPRRNRDLVFVEQRGTAGSHRLQCDLYGNLQSYLDGLFQAAGAEACAAALAGKADLRLYRTAIAMDDLDQVRETLGYSRINLFGTSYGTRGALVYLRRHPDRVRSMILKGVMPFELEPGRDVERSLDLLVSDCEADSTCRRVFPGMKAKLAAALRRFDRGPIAVTVTHPDTKQAGPAQYRKEAFLATMLGQLQNVNGASATLELIEQAAAGDFATLAGMTIADHQGFEMAMASGMALSVFCAENRDGAIGPDPLGPACAKWPRSDTLPDQRPVRSEVPVLLISGHLDPITPPAGAERVARTLPNSRHVVVRYGSHSYSGMGPCVDRIMAAFLEAGSVRGLDTSCVDAIKRPPAARTRKEPP